MKRVVSLVPSWTETLLECDINVVARTRYCIHPQDKIKNIPAVAGTKDVDWQKIAKLTPDLIIFDKEENNKSMADTCPFPIFVSHVQSLSDVETELEKMAAELDNSKLKGLAEEWRNLPDSPAIDPSDLPGVIEWWQKPEQPIEKIIYVIWKNPWMLATKNTFIGSIFSRLGFEKQFVESHQKYPQVILEQMITPNTLTLFSSEPFPFAKFKDETKSFLGARALVDGESFSWFGVRTLRFLQSIQSQ